MPSWQGILTLAKRPEPDQEGARKMNGSRAGQRVRVTVRGSPHLCDCRTPPWWEPISSVRSPIGPGCRRAMRRRCRGPVSGPGSGPGPALRSGGGDARRWGRSVVDMAALRDQPELFRDVASAPMTWRAVHEVDAAVLTDRHRRGNRQQADNSQGLLVHRGCAGAPAGEVVPEPVHRRRARRHRPTDAGAVRGWLRLLLELCSTITSDHHRPRHRALQVSAHQSGSLITT